MHPFLENVVVISGGYSVEREISLKSGKAVLEILLQNGVQAIGLDPTSSCFLETLIQGHFSSAFIALHGKYGEDGCIQGLLQTLGIPYTGSNVLASALAMDKVRSKYLLKEANLPVLPIYNYIQGINFLQKTGLPLAVKPVYAGSSLGISKVTCQNDLEPALMKASQYGHVMIEPWIDGIEVTVGILGREALPVIEIVPKQAFYNYDAKYMREAGTKILCTASSLDKICQVKIQNIAKKAFDCLGCRGWGRIDFIYTSTGPKILEVNTIPGLTPISLVPIAAYQQGLSFFQLIKLIIKNAQCPRNTRYDQDS